MFDGKPRQAVLFPVALHRWKEDSGEAALEVF